MDPLLHTQPLLEADADPDPFVQFNRWYAEATQVMRVPEAMCVSTATRDGRPSSRMVLLKGHDERGFVFHTNYRSRKGAELETNPVAALLFHWDPLGRQVRIEGAVERVMAAESDDYFATRPRGAQVGVHVSHQSQTVDSRETLDRLVAEMAEQFAGAPIPRPDWWGGYRVRADSFEFWQHQDDRLHDRLRYTRADPAEGWRIERLQP